MCASACLFVILLYAILSCETVKIKVLHGIVESEVMLNITKHFSNKMAKRVLSSKKKIHEIAFEFQRYFRLNAIKNSSSNPFSF
jgi:hypothetical protein